MECKAMSIGMREASGGRAYRCILAEKDLKEA